MKKNNVWKIVMVVFIPLSLIAQNENWVYRYNGPGNYYDIAHSIVYGADSNIYAAGHSYDLGTYEDFTVISLTTAGDTNWVYRYDGPANAGDFARSIVYGDDGNLYAVGYSYGSGTNKDFIVMSITTAGDTNWVYRYNGPANNWDEGFSIVYGDDGNLYAAGYSTGSDTTRDFTVISLTAAGDTNWVYRCSGPVNGPVESYSIVYGADSNIYAAGSSTGSNTDFTVISLTTAGDTNWVYRYNGPGDDWDEAWSIVYGADGNLYAAGLSGGSVTGTDFIVISLTTAGDTNWVYSYNGPGNLRDLAKSIIYGADGNLYAAGYSTGSGTSSDFTVISLTTAGDTNWVYRYSGPGNGADMANSIVYGDDGNIYATGYSKGSGTEPDFTVISLTTAGDTNWVYRYNGPGNGWDIANSIVYGTDGNLYTAGLSGGSGTNWDFTVISLPPDLGVQEEKVTVVKKHKYGATIFSGSLLLPEGKTCKVFDITGRVITPDKIKPGIYFVEIDGVISHKVIKIK